MHHYSSEKNYPKSYKKWATKVKKYDWCVINKNVKCKKCTVLWHVYDLRILYVDLDIVFRVIAEIYTEYRSGAK